MMNKYRRIILKTTWLLLVAWLLGYAPLTKAENDFEAEVLLGEAATTLQESVLKGVAPSEYALAVFKLEKSQALLNYEIDHPPPPPPKEDPKKPAPKKKPAKKDENDDEIEEKKPVVKHASRPLKNLLDEVNIYLYWSKVFSDAAVIKELEQIRADSPPLKQPLKEIVRIRMKDSDKKLSKMESDQAYSDSDLQMDAKSAYQDAEQFVKAHLNNDHIVALRWFQTALDYVGTDYGFLALIQAYDAQSRYVSKMGGPKEVLLDTAEMKLISEGDALVTQDKLDQALVRYTQSFKILDNEVAHRRIARVTFLRAQQIKEDLLQKMEALQSETRLAYESAQEIVGIGKSAHKEFNPNNKHWILVKKKYADIHNQNQQNICSLQNAQFSFEKVLKFTSDNRDFESAAFVGIVMHARSDQKNAALQTMQRFLKDYEPNTMPERMLREYCQTSVDYLGGK